MTRSCTVVALSSKKSFRRLTETGDRARSRSLSLVYRLDDSLDTINVAYSVGKKVGKAVIRNKVKRRLRSLVREHSNQMPNGDYLVMVSPKVVDRRFTELRDEMRAILPLGAGRGYGDGELDV
ncbi:MAG: ribonuclease P protein component [Acidimicrobiaceae bacterium]|nr:ribonuclease P protein component [Acidimicrobiaceae bacterium]